MIDLKCDYSKCLHDNREIKGSDGYYVETDSSIYHKDCFCVKTNADSVKKMFLNYVRGNTTQSQLERIIDEIIFQEGKNPIEQSKFLNFALTMYISQRKPLRYPAGLRYVIKNKDIIEAWENKKNRFVVGDDEIIIDETLEQVKHDYSKYKPLPRSVSRLIRRVGTKDEDN